MTGKHYSGGCACGAVRYETDSAPVFENHCQCRDCQRRSGTGHSSFLTFADRKAVHLTGKVTEWRVMGDSGKEKTHCFCATCGSPVYLLLDVLPEGIAIHAASLDDPGQFNPAVVTYASAGFGWDRMDPALAAFDTVLPR
ncbi:aldehyde-activating protein [Sneathiella chungangensis]|uniref:Aldehyde-activating protein n=1 Tax=Sneathiella chungangensis TaxID=1418234 RepID=A0A845MCD8_9PROT|nr:GFA family protein [Sneathiella chungangensis]MZR21385.1 aldehyde-activating protein [Sneathiella chungangensis]